VGSPPTGNPGLPADVVRRQYLAAATGDLDTLRETLAADVEWTEMALFPLGGTYRGPDAVVTLVLARLAAE
jgi:ketosteroid isomerase-like protein